jgi:hypothetical protein
MRMKQKNVTPEEWVRHRKLRKKLASAKWYAKKKKKEIEEENTLRLELEFQRAEKERLKEGWIWEDPRDRAYARAVADHLYRGYPVRPEHVDPLEWSAMADVLEEALAATRQRSTWQNVPWNDFLFMKCLRQLGMRELLQKSSSSSSSSSSSNNNQYNNIHKSIELASEYGVVVAGLWVRTMGEYWPEVKRAIHQVQTMPTTNQYMDTNPTTPHSHPPMENPTKSQWYHKSNIVLHEWIQRFVFPIEEPMFDWQRSLLLSASTQHQRGALDPFLSDIDDDSGTSTTDHEHDSEWLDGDGVHLDDHRTTRHFEQRVEQLLDEYLPTGSP